MNLKLAPDLNIVGKNSLRTNTNIVWGKVRPVFPFRQVLKPGGIANLESVRSENFTQRVNSSIGSPCRDNEVPITENSNSKLRRTNVPDFWTLVLEISDINWYLVLGAWNLFICFSPIVNLE